MNAPSISQDADIVIGLADQGSLTPQDGAFFRRVGLTNVWNFVVQEDPGGEVVSPDFDPGSSANFSLGYHWDAIDTIQYSLNGQVIGQLELTSEQTPTPTIGPMFGGVVNADAFNYGVDYLYTVAVRR